MLLILAQILEQHDCQRPGFRIFNLYLRFLRLLHIANTTFTLDDKVRLNWLFNILQFEFTGVLKRHHNLLADHVKNRFGDADACGFGLRLQPRSNIDSITKQVVLSNHYVADVDPHAIYHLVAFWDVFVHCRHPILHFHCALGRINGAGKLDYDAVARGAKNLTIVLSDHAIENLATFSQHPQGVFFIRSHHLAEADHIGRQYRA